MSGSTRAAVLAVTLLIAGCRDGGSSTEADATATTPPPAHTPASESMTQAEALAPLWEPSLGPCPPATQNAVPEGDLALFLEALGLLPTPPDACEATP